MKKTVLSIIAAFALAFCLQGIGEYNTTRNACRDLFGTSQVEVTITPTLDGVCIYNHGTYTHDELISRLESKYGIVID